MRFVPVRTEQQQGVLALHNLRHLLVKDRKADGRVSRMILDALRDQLQLAHDLSRRIEVIGRQLETCERSDAHCRRLRAIPGVGPLTASAIVASVGNALAQRAVRQWCGSEDSPRAR